MSAASGTITYGSYIYGTADSGITIYPVSIDSAPARAQRYIDIPNRNGGIILDDGYYKNVIHSYSVIVKGDTSSDAISIVNRLRFRLLETPGYRKLSDTWAPNEYYRAYLPDGVTFTASPERTMFKTVLNFERMPQRFLTSGDTAITLSTAGETTTVTNSNMPSKPLIRIYRSGSGTKSGTLTVGDIIINATLTTSYIDIDCENGTVVNSSGTSVASQVAMNGVPTLKFGNNSVSFTGDFSSVRITPRWWRL